MTRAATRLSLPRRLFFRSIGVPARLLYAAGLGRLIGRLVLLLTTTGRHTGRPHVTPLQYERVGDVIMVAAARGTAADWYRNLAADPPVEVRLGGERFAGTAEGTSDPALVADFLELRIARHPRVAGVLFRLTGRPDRARLEAYGARRALVTITPEPVPER